MTVWATDATLGRIVYGHDIEPGSTICTSMSSYTYDQLNAYGFAERSAQWCNVTFGQPVEGVTRYGNPVYLESECVFRCPIDGSLQRNADGSMRGNQGYIGRRAA